MKKDKKYFAILLKDWWIAARPFSLTLAVASTTLGIVAAFNQGLITGSSTDIFKIILITVAGICAQLGANFINDYFEGSFRYHRHSTTSIKFLGVNRSYFDVLVFMSGIFSFLLSAGIGLLLVLMTDIRLLFIGIIGIIGSYAYTGEPFVYKRKGLGVPLSFILMGPLMAFGAYFPFAMEFSWYPILVSLPPSFFIPALMLSNEMRDFSRDKGLSLGTLSVRMGSEKSRKLYASLVFGAFALTAVYVVTGVYSWVALFVFVNLPQTLKAYKAVSEFKGLGIPHTNSVHWKFNLIVILSLFFGL